MIFILLSVLTLFYICINWSKRDPKLPSLFLILVYCIVFSNRSMDVADTIPYEEVFSGYPHSMEIGYLFLNNFFNSLGWSFSNFLLLIAIFDFSLWYFCTRSVLKQNNILFALLFFMSNMGMNYYGIVLRSGMASSVMFVPLCLMLNSFVDSNLTHGYKQGKINIAIIIIIFFSFLFIGGLLHQSIYILIISLLLYFVPLRNSYRTLFLILALVITVIPSVPSFISHIVQPILASNDLRMSGRFDGDVETGLSYYQIINVIYGFMYMKWLSFIPDNIRVKQYCFILDIYVVGVFLSGAFSYLTAGSRIGHILIFYEFLMPAILISSNKYIIKNPVVRYCMYAMIVLNFARNLYGTPSLINYIG